MKRIIFIFILTLCITSFSNAQSKDNLTEINKTWAKFYKAFETLDYNLMAEIHSVDLLRISGGSRILDYKTYINNYKIGFERDKVSKQTKHIALRFFERINNDSKASERGVYQLTKNKGLENEQSYYGQFHVILKKTDGKWIITMDYDSSEFNTIKKESFEKAYAIDNLEKFLN